MSKFCKKKSEEQALKDSSARQQALKQLGITQEFNNSDHAEIYNFADCAHVAPIETVDASVHRLQSRTFENTPTSKSIIFVNEKQDTTT